MWTKRLLHDGRGLGGQQSTAQLPHDIPSSIPRDQEYYWSHLWQEGERESLVAHAAGMAILFDSDDPNDIIHYLFAAPSSPSSRSATPSRRSLGCRRPLSRFRFYLLGGVAAGVARANVWINLTDAQLTDLKMRLTTRRCGGCESSAFHTHHLTWYGKRRYK